MISITITGITGNSPYTISICDITKTFCYEVFSGNPILPLELPIPVELIGSLELLVVVVDSLNCEYFQFFSCVPTPTTSTTTTTTTIPPIQDCLCLSFENTTLTNLTYGYTRCDGLTLSGTIFPGTILYYCGTDPTGDVGVAFSIGLPCVNNTCTEPLPIPTTTTTTIPPCTYKQFQDDDCFEFMDDFPYEFQDV